MIYSSFKNLLSDVNEFKYICNFVKKAKWDKMTMLENNEKIEKAM